MINRQQRPEGRGLHLVSSLVPVVILATTLPAAAQCVLSRGRVGHFDAVTIENRLVRIKVLPQVGGRIVEYALKSSGHNQLCAEIDGLAPFRPGDEIPRGVLYEIAGYEDIITADGRWNWPGDFMQVPYALDVVTETPDEVTIRLAAAKGKVRIERTHALRRGTTTLTTVLKVTNTSDESIEMMLRHKCGARVGGAARRNDTIVYPSRQGVTRRKFFPDNIWTDFLLADGWIAASDPVKRETLVLTSRLDGLSNGGMWFDRKHFYNLEFFAKKHRVPAGGSATLTTQWHVIPDMPTVSFAAGRHLGCFEGEAGQDRKFTLTTTLLALGGHGPVRIDGLLYNGPNRIDGFSQTIETAPFAAASTSLTKPLYSPVNEVRARLTMQGAPEIDVVAPLVDPRPPAPVVLEPLTNERFRYTLQADDDCHLWIESTAGHILPEETFEDARPPRNEIGITLLPNEFECFQLAIRPKRGDIDRIEAVFEDLVEIESGATLPAASFGFYRGETVTLEKEGPRYDPLVAGVAVDARKGRNAMLFVELHCDAMQLPGVYEGHLRLRAPGREFQPIRLRVTVRPFQMPHTRSIDTAFWVWKTWNVKGANTTETWPQLARYRLSPGWLRGRFQTAKPIEMIGDDGKARPGTVEVGNAETKDWFVQALHENRINRLSPGWNIWGYADTRQWKHALSRRTRAKAGWLDQIGVLDRCYYQIVDEPLASRFGQLRQVIRLYRQANPDYTIMCTVAINPDLYGYIDMWHVPWGALDPETAQARQALGEKVWLYNAAPDLTGVGRLPRLIGWFCWRYRVDGYLHFAIDYPDSPTVHNPWQSTGSHWTIFFYPTEKTYDEKLPVWENAGKWKWTVPSIRLMQIRDGFEDYEYMNLLRKWIALAKRHNRSEQDVALIDKAEALLGIERAFVGDFISYTDRPEDMMAARRMVGDMIEKIRRSVTGEEY